MYTNFFRTTFNFPSHCKNSNIFNFYYTSKIYIKKYNNSVINDIYYMKLLSYEATY